MKQDRTVFVTATLVSILSLYNLDSRAESVSCDVGYMLPANQKYCVPCNDSNLKKASKNNPATLWCPGGKFAIEQKHQGIQICSADTLADSKHKKCEKKKLVSSRSAKKTVSQNKVDDKKSVARNLKSRIATTKRVTPVNRQQRIAQVNCKPGTYLPMGGKSANDCKSCLDGYYCTGGKWTPDPSMNQGLTKCATGLIPDSTKTKCYDPNADKINCKPGTYLPMGGKSANDCKSCLDGYYCTGGKWTPDPSMNQGLTKCATGLIPDSTKTKCYDPNADKINCKPGTYLPMGGNSCVSCLDGYYCQGGKWTPDPSMNQGLIKCASGLISNSDKTLCKVPDAMDCKVGEYIPANSTKCVKCTGANKYCPGVAGKKSDIDQGIYLCPDLSKPNSEKSACVMTLTKTMMQYGPGGQTVALSEQCWKNTTAEEYIKCMFGNKVKLPQK